MSYYQLLPLQTPHCHQLAGYLFHSVEHPSHVRGRIASHQYSSSHILLVLIARSMDEFESYQKITLALGIIGLIAFWIMFFNVESIYMPILERLSVYTLILWSFITGVFLVKI